MLPTSFRFFQLPSPLLQENRITVKHVDARYGVCTKWCFSCQVQLDQPISCGTASFQKVLLLSPQRQPDPPLVLSHFSFSSNDWVKNHTIDLPRGRDALLNGKCSTIYLLDIVRGTVEKRNLTYSLVIGSLACPGFCQLPITDLGLKQINSGCTIRTHLGGGVTWFQALWFPAGTNLGWKYGCVNV